MLFVDLLDLSFLVNLCLPLLEFSPDLAVAGDGAFVPRVGLDFFEGKSVSIIILEHEGDEVLELLAEEGETTWLVGTVAPPEYVRPVHKYLIVKLVLLGICSVEGGMTGNHDEQNDC